MKHGYHSGITNVVVGQAYAVLLALAYTFALRHFVQSAGMTDLKG